MAQENTRIISAFKSSQLSDYIQDCARYIEIINNPTVELWSPLREHAIYSIIDIAIINPAIKTNNLTLSHFDKANKFEKLLRKTK